MRAPGVRAYPCGMSKTTRTKPSLIELRAPLRWIAAQAPVNAAEGDENEAEDNSDEKELEAEAYNGGIADIPYWGASVFELSSMTVEAGTHPMLCQHDIDRPLGVVDSVDKTDKAMACKGRILMALKASPEIVAAAKAGFPYQASVGLRPGTQEYVDAGVEVEVNGQKLTGPFTLHKLTAFREMSVVTFGGDRTTKTRIAAQEGDPMDVETTETTETVEAEVNAEGTTTAVQASERGELKDLLATYPGHEAIVAKAWAEGETEAGVHKLIAKGLAKELDDATKRAETLQAELKRPDPGFNGGARERSVDAGQGRQQIPLTLEAQAREAWNKAKPELRAEYGQDFRLYLADCKHEGEVVV